MGFVKGLVLLFVAPISSQTVSTTTSVIVRPSCSDLPPDPVGCTQFSVGDGCTTNIAVATLCPITCNSCDDSLQTLLPSTFFPTVSPTVAPSAQTAVSHFESVSITEQLQNDRTFQIVVFGLVLVVVLNVILMLIIVCRRSASHSKLDIQQQRGHYKPVPMIRERRNSTDALVPLPFGNEGHTDFADWRMYAGRSKYAEEPRQSTSRGREFANNSMMGIRTTTMSPEMQRSATPFSLSGQSSGRSGRSGSSNAPNPPPRERAMSDSAALEESFNRWRRQRERFTSMDDSFNSNINEERVYARVQSTLPSPEQSGEWDTFKYTRQHVGGGAKRDSRRPLTSRGDQVYLEPQGLNRDVEYLGPETGNHGDEISRVYEYADVPDGGGSQYRAVAGYEGNPDQGEGVDGDSGLSLQSNIEDHEDVFHSFERSGTPPRQKSNYLHAQHRRTGAQSARSLSPLSSQSADSSNNRASAPAGERSTDDFDKELTDYLREQQAKIHSSPKRNSEMTPESKNSANHKPSIQMLKNGNSKVRKLSELFDEYQDLPDETGVYANTIQQTSKFEDDNLDMVQLVQMRRLKNGKQAKARRAQQAIEHHEQEEHLYDLGSALTMRPGGKVSVARRNKRATLGPPPVVYNPAFPRNAADSAAASTAQKRATIMDPFDPKSDLNAKRKIIKKGKKSRSVDLSASLPAGLLLHDNRI